MECAKTGWVYFMANRYRGTLYVGVTSDLAARVDQPGGVRARRFARSTA